MPERGPLHGPLHVTKWAADALDQDRREVWNAARRAGDKRVARDLKGARWALWKGGERISARQRSKLDWVERINRPLYQAYLLKEHLRLVFQPPCDAALDLLESWLEAESVFALAAVRRARRQHRRTPRAQPQRPSTTASPTLASKPSTHAFA
jgi:transposase